MGISEVGEAVQRPREQHSATPSAATAVVRQASQGKEEDGHQVAAAAKRCNKRGPRESVFLLTLASMASPDATAAAAATRAPVGIGPGRGTAFSVGVGA